MKTLRFHKETLYIQSKLVLPYICARFICLICQAVKYLIYHLSVSVGLSVSLSDVCDAISSIFVQIYCFNKNAKCSTGKWFLVKVRCQFVHQCICLLIQKSIVRKLFTDLKDSKYLSSSFIHGYTCIPYVNVLYIDQKLQTSLKFVGRQPISCIIKLFWENL